MLTQSRAACVYGEAERSKGKALPEERENENSIILSRGKAN